MAKYRLYKKSGIYGCRYKGYYIVRGEKDIRKYEYHIVTADNEPVGNTYDNYWDCEWEIDKMTASDNEMEIMKSLYNEKIYQLSQFFVQLMEKSNTEEGLTSDEDTLYKLVTKIRSRKAEKKAF